MKKPKPLTVYCFGEVAFCPEEMEIRIGKEVKSLMPRESQILEVLVKNPERLISKDEIMEEIWGNKNPVEEVNVAKLVHLLRKKLGGGKKDEFIKTRHNHGYKFVRPVKERKGWPSRGGELPEQVGRSEEIEAVEAEVAMLAGSSEERKAEYIFDLTKKASQELTGRGQGSWLNTLEAVRGELVETLDYYHKRKDGADKELQMAVRLAFFWDFRGYRAEGLRLLGRALGRHRGGPSVLKATGMAWVGALQYIQNNYPDAKQSLVEAVGMSRAIEDKECLALSLLWSGNLAEAQGRYSEAKGFLEEGLELSKEIQVDWLIAKGVNRLGLVFEEEGDYLGAKEMQLQYLGMSQGQDTRCHAAALSNLSTIAHEQGNLVEARRHLERSAALRQEIRHRCGMADCSFKLGLIEESAGRLRDAEGLFRQSLEEYRALGDKHWQARAVEGIGRITYALGAEDGAALVFGAADVLRGEIKAPLSPKEMRKYGGVVSAMRKREPERWKMGRERGDEIVVDIVSS